MARTLSVYLYENYVGDLVQDESGQFSFTYKKEWLNHPNRIPLSHSLPLRLDSFTRKECQGFFEGILPEEKKREMIAKNLGISAHNDFAMLEKIGGECAGAVTFLSEGETLKKIKFDYQTLSELELLQVLKTLPRRPLMAGERGIRLSLAGAQDKISVLVKKEEIFIPLYGAPSSHILKPANEYFEDLVTNEHLCLQLASKLGLPVAKSSIHTVQGYNYLLVERYDRKIDKEGNLQRIHQEDFCQALGFASDMKYQSEGGPSLKQCFELVRNASSTPVLDLKNLLDAVIYNFLIMNADAHGKNFSLLYQDGKVRMAPLYDLVCTASYPELSQNMAMKIGGERKATRIGRRHFEKMAKEVGLTSPMVLERIKELASKLKGILNEFKSESKTVNGVLQIIRDQCIWIERLFST
jgi:serine/threonine-protein kinase HipA